MSVFWQTNEETGVLTEADLRAAFKKMEQQARETDERRARFARSWAQAFPNYDGFETDDLNFLHRMWLRGHRGEPIHPNEFKRLEELRRRQP